MAELGLSSALQFLLSLGAKFAYTVILAAIVVLCVAEIYKLWGDRSPVLTMFQFNKDGTVVAANGEAFTRSIHQQQRLLRSMFDGQRRNESHPVLTDDATIQFGRLSVAELRTSDLSELKIEAQGINLTALLGKLRNWIRSPNEIRGRVDQVGSVFHVFAEWSAASDEGVKEGIRFYSDPHSDLPSASFEIAARLLWNDIVGNRHPLPLARSLIEHVSEENFVKFMRAWLTYQNYLAARGRREDLSKQKAGVENALEDLKNLTDQAIAFPPIYNLAANLKLQAKPISEMSDSEKNEFRNTLTHYLALMRKLGLEDKSAEKNLAAITEVQPAATRVAAAATAAPSTTAPAARAVALAGGSISPVQIATAGSACCIVTDPAGIRYLITAGYLFPAEFLAKNANPEVLSPARLDGGTERIGILEKVHTISVHNASIALVRLDDDVESKNEIPGIGEFTEIATFPDSGQVSLYGRSSELRTGAILAINAELNLAPTGLVKGLVEVERLSLAGDGGAPVLDSDHRLVGMAYAGSDKQSLVLPLKPVFEELSLSLLKPG